MDDDPSRVDKVVDTWRLTGGPEPKTGERARDPDGYAKSIALRQAAVGVPLALGGIWWGVEFAGIFVALGVLCVPLTWWLARHNTRFLQEAIQTWDARQNTTDAGDEVD